MPGFYTPNGPDGVYAYLNPVSQTIVLSLTASATITAGQILVISGSGTVAPSAGPSGLVCGVASSDVTAGQKVIVWPIGPGICHESVTPAGVTALDAISAGAAGGVTTGTLGTLAAAGQLLGTVLVGAAAGQKCRWVGAP
jgi:hypothetical protein